MKDNRNLKTLNTMRILGIEAINQANSGHPGIVLGAAPVMYTLLTKMMHVNPENPLWFNRDRFVLSAGHGSALLYSALHLSGYQVSMADLKKFRQIDSLTPGHPEFGHTAGVDATTGPLGQGIAMAVGMALAESHLRAKFNKDNFNIVDHHTFVICGDGDLQEGISQEAISFAGRYKLNRLIILHDSNDIQLDAPVAAAQAEDMQLRFQAAHWNTVKITDGEDLEAIEKAIAAAKTSDKPTYIEVKTVIGIGATNQGTQKVHGAPLGTDIATVKKYFNWDNDDFTVEQEVYDFYKTNVAERGKTANAVWDKMLQDYQVKFPQEAAALQNAIAKKYDVDLTALAALNHRTEQATRVSSGAVFNELAKMNPAIIGGSADLSESTKIKGADGNYDWNNLTGRNIMYGVREFAMAAINNGIALHGGLLPVASGFFVFTDYMKPAIRMSALSNLQALYVFTHDSLAVGEDGPTHQPIEQLAMLRSTPNVSLYRPCDMAETIASYANALADHNRPSIIVATRQNLKELQHENINTNIKKGAYIISDCDKAQVTLIATGSEVALAFDVKAILANDGIATKIVSMPNMNLFKEQPLAYQAKIIDKNTKRFSIELGSTFGWQGFLGDDGIAFGCDHFGYSAPFNDVMQKIRFTAADIAAQIKKAI
jgi:transketolase